MTDMSRDNSASSVQGFSVYQPSLGAALQFFPALGTQQLDDLINAYLPGSASIKEKRTMVTMEFFDYSQVTGEMFKFYPVYSMSLESMATSAFDNSLTQDSGYSSSFVSPVVSDWSWSQSTPSSASCSTPGSSVHENSQTKASRKAPSSVSRAQTSDFSHMPGMKIMTKDGQDVTNSASRGCKTKEQRDHAHLMRIIKACEACRKKKIKCDPSHKKRSAPQSQSQTATSRSKKQATSSQSRSRPGLQFPVAERLASSSQSPPFTATLEPGLDFQEPTLNFQEDWESFVHSDEQMDVVPFDYDFFLDVDTFADFGTRSAPATGLSMSPTSDQYARADHHASQSTLATQAGYANASPDDHVRRPPSLPYLQQGGAGNDYLDFTLYSPQAGFLDEELFPTTDIGSFANTGRRPSSPSRATAGGNFQATAQYGGTSASGSLQLLSTGLDRSLQCSPTPGERPTDNAQFHANGTSATTSAVSAAGPTKRQEREHNRLAPDGSHAMSRDESRGDMASTVATANYHGQVYDGESSGLTWSVGSGSHYGALLLAVAGLTAGLLWALLSMGSLASLANCVAHRLVPALCVLSLRLGPHAFQDGVCHVDGEGEGEEAGAGQSLAGFQSSSGVVGTAKPRLQHLSRLVDRVRCQVLPRVRFTPVGRPSACLAA